MNFLLRKIFLIVAGILVLSTLNSQYIYSQSNKQHTNSKQKVSSKQKTSSKQPKSASNKEPIKITNKITDKHLFLVSISNVLYIVPPDESFIIDTNKTVWGLSSNKYNTDIRFSFQLTGIQEDYEQQSQQNKILKYELVQSNDLNIKYYKLKSLNTKSTLISWLIICENDFDKFYGTISYDKKYDNELSAKIENSFRSIVFIQNPSVNPQRNAAVNANYDMLGLKFVQKVSIPISYFTEDGKPFNKTKGTRMLAIVAIPIAMSKQNPLIEYSIQTANQILEYSIPGDSIIVQKILETEFVKYEALRLEGALTLHPEKSFICYGTRAFKTGYAVLGICNEAEKNEFFEIIDKFIETVVPIFE